VVYRVVKLDGFDRIGMSNHFPTICATFGRKIGITNGTTIQAEKLSISLPIPLVQFIESYKVTHQCRSLSQVIERALELLRMQELEGAYRQAAEEVDPAWERAIADGLSNETW
jgi:Arc/MetJ-type ribon-helix-helix transcriptional regulator